MSKHHMHPYTSDANDQDQAPNATADTPHEEEIKMPDPAADTSSGQDAAPKPEDVATPDPEEAAKAQIEDMRLRMAAEMDNFKKRLTRDHQEQVRYATEKVLADLLPALDNLDLAIQYGSTHEACKDMMQGIEMTRRQLLDAVAKSGLLSLGERGEPFDPTRHEAVGMEAAPDVEPGAVSRVLQRGYKLHDRLLRPAKVMVNN